MRRLPLRRLTRRTAGAPQRLAALLLLAAVTACAEGGDASARAVAGGAGPAPASGTGAAFADYDPGAVPGGPGAGRRYGLGRAPEGRHLRLVDLDVGADGAELPAGRGTVADGATLYKVQCAMCHGPSGEGIHPAFPRLLGRAPEAEGFRFANDPKLEHGIGNYWPHATTLFDYIRRAMPLTAPGSLTDDQVYALTAYLLAADDVIPDTTTLDAARLRAVRMPYADRFVPDDRKPNAPAK